MPDRPTLSTARTGTEVCEAVARWCWWETHHAECPPTLIPTLPAMNAWLASRDRKGSFITAEQSDLLRACLHVRYPQMRTAWWMFLGLPSDDDALSDLVACCLVPQDEFTPDEADASEVSLSIGPDMAIETPGDGRIWHLPLTRVHAAWLSLPHPRPHHPLKPLVDAWQRDVPLPAEWDDRRHVNLPAPLAATRRVLLHRELRDGQVALPFDYDAIARTVPSEEPRFEVGYLPTLAPNPSKLVPSPLLDLWDTGPDRGRGGPVALARRIGLEVLLATPPDARPNEHVALDTTMGNLAGAVWPGTRYSSSRHGQMLLSALREVHNGKVAWSDGERGALRVLVTVHDWPRNFAHNAPLAFGVMLPPGSRQGAQIDRYAVRGTWHSYRQNRLLLVAYCLFDRYGTVRGRMISPTIPVVQRDSAGYVLGASGKVLTERGKPSRRATHPRAIHTGQREPNPEALRHYPVLTGRDLILAGYPSVADTLAERRDQRRRVLDAARELAKPVTKPPNRGAPDRRRHALLRVEVRGRGTATELRLMPSDDYLAAHASRWAARKYAADQ